MSTAGSEVGGGRFNLAGHLIEVNAGRADAPAFIDDSGVLTYGQLEERVRCMAAGLRRLDVRREERVLLLLHDGNDWPVAFLGALYAGVVPVPVNTLLTADDYAYMLAHSRARMAVVSGALLPTLTAAMEKSEHELDLLLVSHSRAPLQSGQAAFDEFLAAQTPAAHPVATDPDAPGFWLYSSGSTGRPKAVVHSQVGAYWTAELYGKAVLGLTSGDVCFSAAKLFFAYGLGNALTFPLSVGATTLLAGERPTPEAVFRRWRGEVGGVRPSVFFGAPTGYAAMLAHPALPSRQDVALRLCSSAGEALPADIGVRFGHHYGIDIIDGIGSTEALHIFISNLPRRVRYGASGWPVRGYDVELRGDGGGSVPDGEPGDLYVRGPSTAMQYWCDRKQSQRTFLGEWLRTGDKYLRNEDGSLTFCGRTDDMLKVSGIYVSPFEVESVLVEHPAVLEAAVVGVPDADGLTKTKAFVVLGDSGHVGEDELKVFVKDRLAPYKYPRSIEFVAELPKTATGKVQRFKLRAGQAASAGGSATGAVHVTQQ